MSRDALIASLRDLPADAWDSWLVLADALTEAGDERGALLVREHRGDAVRDDAIAWMYSWCAYLADADVDTFEWLARFHGFAWRAPPELAPVFAQPVSQLLALLPIAADPPPPLSRVLVRQRDRILAAVAAWIDRAFDGVPVPDEHHRTIHQAHAEDTRRVCDRSRDHLGRWQDLPDSHLLANQWAFAHLDEQGIPYYVPATMRFALRHFAAPHVRDLNITEGLEYTLAPAVPALRAYQALRFAALDREQRAAICAYVLTTPHAEAAAAWLRVVELERTGPRDDWYAHYAP